MKTYSQQKKREWQGPPSPRQRPKFSADGRAGKVDLLERALCLFAISSLLRVRTLKPRPLSPFPLTVVADSQLVCAGVLNSLIVVWHLACFAGVAGRGCCKCSSAARCWRLFFDWSACAHRAPPGKPRRCLGTCASREHATAVRSEGTHEHAITRGGLHAAA